MKLTDEQIAHFQARAEAGENPMLPGWEFVTGLFWRLELWHDKSIARVVPSVVKAEWSIEIQLGMPRHIHGFPSDIAGQLAVEHLLREATQRLHAEAYRNLEDLREWHD